MRRLWSCVILAVVALLVFATASVGAAGKRSFSLYENEVNKTDCSFHPYFEWTNYPDRSTYTARVWVLRDGIVIPHPTYSWLHVMDWTYSGYSGTAAMANGGSVNTDTTAHTVTYRATLTKEGDHPRVVIDTTVVFSNMYCGTVAS